MLSQLFVGKRFLGLFTKLVAMTILASQTFAGNSWTGGGATQDWSDANNWGGALPGYGTLTFSSGGTVGTTSWMNVNWSMNQLLWTGSSSWILNGNSTSGTISLYDNGGTQARIENQSSGSVTIRANVTFAATAGAAWGEINAVNGNVTFDGTNGGVLTVNGSQVAGIRMYGSGRTTSFNGTVTATGKYFATVGTNTTMAIGGSFTSGDVYVMNNGTLNLSSGANTSSAIRLGGDYGATGAQNLAQGGTLALTSATGGISSGSSITTVVNNTSGSLVLDSQNTSGTNTLTGGVYLDSGLTIRQTSGGSLTFSNGVFNFKSSTLTVSNAGTVTIKQALTANAAGGSLVKTGAGTLILENTSNQYSGTSSASLNANATQINAGVLGIYGDGSLGLAPGGAYNNIQFTGSGTLQNTANNISLNSNRNISVANGVIGTFDNNGNIFTINGVINGGGGVSLTGSGTTVFAGANTYTGTTTLNAGTLTLSGGNNRIATGNTLTFGGTSTLNLGGNSQTLATLTAGSSSTSARTFTITNGTLNVTAPSANFSFNGTNNTALDMSGLTAFTFTGASNNRSFTLQPDISTGTSFNTNYIYLAANGAGSNLITASTVLIGNAVGSSAGSGNEARLILGKTNAIYAQALTIGLFNGSGLVDFGAGIVDGSLTLRGSNGVAAMTNLLVGDMNSGSRRGTGSLNLGIADAVVTDTFIGQARANSITNLTQTNSISMAGGNFVGTNLIIGMGAATLTNTVITNVSSFSQLGGTSSISTIRMGDDRAGSNTVTYTSTYALSGSSTLLRAQTIDAGTNASYGANTVRTLQLSNGATLRNASGTNLTIGGFTNTAAGRMNIVMAGDGIIEADNNQSVIFNTNTILSGSGRLTKTGLGTLTMTSNIAPTHSGAVNIVAGTLNAAVANALGTSSALSISNGATYQMGAAQTVGSIAGAGTISFGANSLTFGGDNSTTSYSGAFTGTGTLIKSGTGTNTLTGTGITSGTVQVNAGGLTLNPGAGNTLNLGTRFQMLPSSGTA
ncbi:MAG: hypothetical protein EBV83_06505, partial [Verrucomicrobia bacterium]|nr:hypothetical protein [Verrucomicrobiota bacterium]